MKYQYRKKRQFWTSNKEVQWADCTEKQKAQLEVTAKGRFEFKEIKQPNPTPSMKSAQKSKEKPTEEGK